MPPENLRSTMPAGYVNVKIDGQELDHVKLHALSVTQELNQHGWCHLDCRQTEDQRFSIESWLGKTLEVLSYDQNGIEHQLFSGFVFEAELDYEISGSFIAHVTGVTKTYKMDVTPRHAYYLSKTLAEVAQQATVRAGLNAVISCKQRRALNYSQWGETDFSFLRRLVDDCGGWMRPSPDGIEIYDAFQDGPDLLWRGGSGNKGLLSFSVKGTLSPPSCDGAHYNPHEMASQTYQGISDKPQFYDSITPLVDSVQQASKDTLPAGYVPDRTRAVTLADYEDRLKKESVRSLGSSVQGSGSSLNQEVHAGDTVKIIGVLDALGEYGVTQVTHSWDAAGYQNQFVCTPWKNYTDPQPPEMKPWHGVVPARVVEHNDPKMMGRIKVQYFWQEEGPAYWARMMAPHSGGNRGFMFMPEVGDEVVVAFEDGDPERPVVLGCVWNGVDTAPREDFWGDDIGPNDVKRIVTKSGNRIQMVDKQGKEAIVMGTPNSVRVALIANANETGRETLLLESSAGDIIINAPNGRVHLHCKHFSREVG